ncbi:hypothetical protein D9M69_532610 [compost metagenome]
MHVHRIGPNLCADRVDVVASRHSELPTVTSLVVFHPVNVGIGCQGLIIVDSKGRVEHRQRITAVLNKVVRCEECAAARQHGFAPLQFVEGFERKVVGDAEVTVEHIARQVRLFELRTRAHEGSHVERVDFVNPALEEQPFAPIDYLLTETKMERAFAHVEVAKDIRV